MQLQKFVNLIIASIVIFGISIPRVMADDCDILYKAIKNMGRTMKKEYNSVGDCCKFKGITCDSERHVTEVQFKHHKDSSANVSRAIEELVNLKYLESLEINNVRTTGGKFIPSVIGEFKNLKTLIIRDNYDDLSGSKIPDEIGDLTNLEKLDLNNNKHNGPIPKSLANLHKLKTLILADNSLEGVIPYEFKDLENLVQFTINGNSKLKGYVPQLQKVRTCDYSDTKLCSLKDLNCAHGIRECSKDQIKQTNKENGSPDEDEFIEEDYKETESKKGLSDTAKFIILFIVLFVIISMMFCTLGYCVHKSKDKEDDVIQNNSFDNSEIINPPTGTPYYKNDFTEIINPPTGTPIYNNEIGETVETYDDIPVDINDINDADYDDNNNNNDDLNNNLSTIANASTLANGNTNVAQSNTPGAANITVNISIPYNGQNHTVDINENSMITGQANNYVDLSTPYDNTLTPYNNLSTATPITNNKINDSMMAGAADNYVDISTPYDNKLTPYK